MKLQITFFHNEGKYKPVSTIIEVESIEQYEQHKAQEQRKALMNIAHYKHTTPQDLIRQGYTKVKTREYDVDKIKEQQDFQHRVNLLKYYVRKRAEKKNKKLKKTIDK